MTITYDMSSVAAILNIGGEPEECATLAKVGLLPLVDGTFESYDHDAEVGEVAAADLLSFLERHGSAWAIARSRLRSAACAVSSSGQGNATSASASGRPRRKPIWRRRPRNQKRASREAPTVKATELATAADGCSV